MVGAVFAVAAYGMALLWGVSPLWSIPVAVIVLNFIGAGLHHAMIRQVADRDMFIPLLATFGLTERPAAAPSALTPEALQAWGEDLVARVPEVARTAAVPKDDPAAVHFRGC